MLNRINRNLGQSNTELLIVFTLMMIGIKFHPLMKSETFSKDNIKKLVIGDVYAEESVKEIKEMFKTP